MSERRIVLKVNNVDTEEHPFLAYAGPLLKDGVVYTVNCEKNQVAALNKNLSEQLPVIHLDGNVWSSIPGTRLYIEEFAKEFVGRGVGCCGRNPVPAPTIYSLWCVVAHAARKNAAKAASYLLYILEYLGGRVEIDSAQWRGRWFVKTEILKIGKAPRLIFNCEKAIVALSRAVNYPFESWLKEGYVTVKGLPTSERYRPVSVIADNLMQHGVPYVISIDCTARDANVREHDFVLYSLILRLLDMLSWILQTVCSYHGAFGSTKNYKVSVGWVSLLSGVDFTSTLNFVVSVFGAWYYCEKVLRIPRSHWGVAAEGDDNCILISRPYALAMLKHGCLPVHQGDSGHSLVIASGMKLGKRWKVEYAGWLDDTHGHPFVGGRVVYHEGLYTFFPLWDRFILKAGAIVTRDVVNLKVLLGRVTARADALTDRFDRYPVAWLYANLVRAHADTYGATARRTKEESYEYESSSRRRTAREPDTHTRVSFARTFGISIEQQFVMENHLRALIRDRVWFDDMRLFTQQP